MSKYQYAEDPFHLAPLWDRILEIYEAYRGICEKHGLRYYAIGGTLLGAVRHKGFIPWDDDFDVGMPRPDYERFIRAAQDELPTGLSWHSLENDEQHPYLFGKVKMDNDKEVRELHKATRLNLSQGVFIDVFPLDGLPSTRLGMLWFCVRRALLRRAVGGKKWWGSVFGMRSNVHQNLLRLQEWYSSWKYDECQRAGAVSPYDNTRTLRRWWFEKVWFKSAKMVPFEDTEVPIPVGSHELMTNVFGDYMTPPPVEMRHPAHQ